MKKTNQTVNKFKSNVLNKISFFYTNADQLRNKLDELQIRIQSVLPKIIGITEVKGKNTKFLCNPAEFSLDILNGYNMFYANIDKERGRGLVLYVHSSLQAEEVHFNTEFEETLFIKLKINNSENMLVGLVYRSPSDNMEEKNKQLRDLLSEAASDTYSQCVIMGDFNYPSIDWDMLNTGRTDSVEGMFLNCLDDNFLFQVVNKPTRWRGSDKPSLLDLVITKDEAAIDNIEFQSPIGKSDHRVIAFDYTCQAALRSIDKKQRNYRKGNYTKIREDLNSTD